MNSFTLTAVGHLARNPEVVAKGDVSYTRFCLMGNDYAGKDDEGAAREVTTSVWLTAFGALGDSIARHARKGDQLVVEARLRSSNWTDKQGEKKYDYAFVVQGFKFGAPGKVKREEFDGRREQTLGLPRAEDRANGRERDESHVLNGEGGESHDAAVAAAHDKEASGEQEEVGPERGDTGPTAGSVRVAVEVRDPVSTNGSADTPGAAKVAQEKTRGSRSTRKSAASAA
jgi:single-strand DNA-binding protein